MHCLIGNFDALGFVYYYEDLFRMKKKIIPITRPTLEPFGAYAPLFKKIIESGMLTTSINVREFEKRVAEYLGVKYCVATSSCTAGLMLVCKGLGLTSEVIVPSFTFSASGLPLLWNNLTPVFADIDSETYAIDPKEVEKLITKKTSAILATHVFGVPANVAKLSLIARKHRLKLVFDAAHAFGSTQGGKKVGCFGDAEVFSCSPTKVLTTGEGGIVATNDKALADFVREGRNYGGAGGNDIVFAGLSARMSELSAAIGLRSLQKLSANLKRRRAAARYLTAQFLKIEPRLRFQTVPKNAETTYKDLSVHIDPRVLGYTRDELHDFFASHDIMTRKYFYPPLHRMRAYKTHLAPGHALPITERIASCALSLPMYAHITKGDMNRIVKAFKEFTYARKES